MYAILFVAASSYLLRCWIESNQITFKSKYPYLDQILEKVNFIMTSTSSTNIVSNEKVSKLTLTTWNVAAINNNPFEYWLTIENKPEYEKLMTKIENFIESPGEMDIPVKQVFTDDMFKKLDSRLTSVGWESMVEYWKNDFSNRLIVKEFLKDPLLGSKRLASMPDRVTNTINVANSNNPICRPTIINMYEGDLTTLEQWYSSWESFMFDTKLSIPNTKDKSVSDKIPYEMLLPIKKSKYPDITEEEEKVSLPLQTLCGAIFDAILVYMMNTVSQPSFWQPLKKQIVDSLVKEKIPKTISILEMTYADTSSVIMMQEVSLAMINAANNSNILQETFHIIAPDDIDAVRDQNSIILLNKFMFPNGADAEITFEISKTIANSEKKVPVAKGDLIAITAKDVNNISYVIASFHGDTNGLASVPVLDAVMSTVSTSYKDYTLLFGLDANTYEKGKAGKKQDVMEFASFYSSLNLTSCFGDEPNPKNYTTFNARTYLQPQLNKACKSNDKRKGGDVNPKDFILFTKDQFEVVQTFKDNTGKKLYIEDMAFPTLDFPSDHGILTTVIKSIQA